MRFLMIALLLIVMRRPAHAEIETYRTPIAVLDGIGLGLAVPGVVGIAKAEGGTRALAIVATSIGSALYIFGAPITHYVKQDTKDKYYASMLMRVVGTGLIAGLGAKLGKTRCPADDSTCDDLVLGLAIGAAIGAAAVTAIDLSLLARRRVAINPVAGGATLGIAGRW